MSIKAAFFDIDGTLFSHSTHQVPPSAVEALNILRSHGIITVICTGRHQGELEKLDLKGLVFDYIITLNGQMVRSNDKTLIASFPFKDEDIDGYVLIEQKNNQLAATYYSDEKMDSDLKSELLTSLNTAQQQLNLSKAKLTTKQSQSLATRAQFKQKVKHVDKKSFDNDPVKQISFWVLLIILYMLVITYTQVTAQDIATEKGTKIMEVIFSSMPGGDYFTGKILGIFGEIITQVLIYVVGFVAVYCAAPYIDGFSDLFRQYKPMIDQAIGNLASWGLVFTIIGLVLFIIFAAFCGALVAKSENANKAVGPLSTLMLIGFLFTVNMQSGGDTIFAKVLSYIPFLSSFVMPARVIMGNATNLEAAISALIALAATVASFIWIRKIYPNLILQTDDVGPWQNFKRSLRG